MLPCVGSTKDRVLMTSKCGEGEKVVHEAEPSELLMLLPHFASSFIYYWTERRQHEISLFCIVKRKILLMVTL